MNFERCRLMSLKWVTAFSCIANSGFRFILMQKAGLKDDIVLQ